MPPGQPSIDVIRQKLKYASSLGEAVGDAVKAAVPGILQFEISCRLDGTAEISGIIVEITGIVSSDDARQRAEAAARAVKNVQRLINSLTVA